MKQFLFLFLFVTCACYSQDFNKVDALVKAYPRFTSPEKLANKIAQDFNNDANKVRAAFKWLTNNIRYNLEEYYQPKRVIQFRYSTEEERLQKIQALKDKIVSDAFIRKIGVCEEYAQSFKKLADLLGIEAQVIKGYVRNSAQEIGRVPRTTNHAWNSVKINNQWVLLDATWAAGYVFNGKWVQDYNNYFFAVDHKKIGKTHFPNNKKWQIVTNLSTIEKFYEQPIYSQAFLKSGLEIITPTKGNVSINKSKEFVLNIKNLSPNDRLYYNYKGQRYSKKAAITYKGNVAKVVIENPGRNSDLHIFLNRDLALIYKIFVR
tara:strand:- start:52948 stop:53904 length:957 start_codon:yes stop_codon:yes gene_type:complete